MSLSLGCHYEALRAKMLPDVITYNSERGQLLPAGYERAGATNSMALAGHFHVLNNRLNKNIVLFKLIILFSILNILYKNI